VTMRATYFLAAAACLCAACRAEPKIDQTVPAPQAARLSPSPAPPAIADSGAVDADGPVDAGLSALAGTWHGRMTYNTAPSPPGLGDDNGIRGRAVSARIYDEGAISLAIQQYEVGAGFGQTGASSRCTIEGVIEKRGDRLVFAERLSRCQGQYALARRTGLDLQSPCLLRFTDLGKPAGAGALFTLKRQGCAAAQDR
jgi:hypothetical protein